MSEQLNVQMLIIDPQNDFCTPSGSLFVQGADKDSIRLASFIKAILPNLDDIHVTLDTHHTVSIFHSIFWVDSKGKHPLPFTMITHDDVVNGKWKTTNPAMHKWGLYYTEELQKHNRYALIIWPYHCLIGTPGHNVVTPIAEVLKQWEEEFAMVDYVTKGTNYKVEHYSAVQADVVIPTDPTTQLNTGLIQTLQDADILFLSGQALSHCVAYTVKDIADNFGDENIKKMVLIEDTTSPVQPDPPGTTLFSDSASQFIIDMKARGMQTCRSTDIDFISRF